MQCISKEMKKLCNERLRRAQRKQSPPSFDVSSNDEEDTSYRQRLGTPPSEFFSSEEEHLQKEGAGVHPGRV